ncbi:hypothetical protein ABIA14_004868 [Sinorhizobium fredii]
MPIDTQPLPGSIATASTLAFALVHRYVDGTPLYRLAQAFERAGVPVSRGALGHWVIGSSERHLSRIYDALKLRLRAQALIHGDETTVQVLKEKDKEATSTSFMWAYRSGEDSGEPIVLLDYQPGRGQIDPQAFLGDYRGILMSDGYTAWRTLNGATHVGCMAHSRRRFVDALKARKKGGGPPEQALKFFEQLSRIESQARDKTPDAGETKADCIRRFRQQHSVPILNALKAWLDDINITKGYGQIGEPQAPKIEAKNLKLGAITCRNRRILTIKCQTTTAIRLPSPYRPHCGRERRGLVGWDRLELAVADFDVQQVEASRLDPDHYGAGRRRDQAESAPERLAQLFFSSK